MKPTQPSTEVVASSDYTLVTGGTKNKFVECALAKFALEGFSVVRTKTILDTRDLVLWILERCRAGKVPTFTPGFVFQPAGGKKFRKKDYGKNSERPRHLSGGPLQTLWDNYCYDLTDVTLPGTRAVAASLDELSSLKTSRGLRLRKRNGVTAALRHLFNWLQIG